MTKVYYPLSQEEVEKKLETIFKSDNPQLEYIKFSNEFIKGIKCYDENDMLMRR